MFCGKRNNRDIVNLYKVVDFEYAKAFDIKVVVSTILNELNKLTNQIPTNFDVNYTKDCKSLKTFHNLIDSQKEVVYVCIGYANNLPLISISNNILNQVNPPAYDSIDIQIEMEEEYSLHALTPLIYKILNILPCDYGYIVNLPLKYDAGTERKRKGLFLPSVEIHKNDTFFFSHTPALKFGYLRSVYKYNFINNNHLKNPFISLLIKEGVGKVSSYSDTLHLWTCADNEVAKAKDYLIKNKLIMWSELDKTPLQSTSDLEKYNRHSKIN